MGTKTMLKRPAASASMKQTSSKPQGKLKAVVSSKSAAKAATKPATKNAAKNAPTAAPKASAKKDAKTTRQSETMAPLAKRPKNANNSDGDAPRIAGSVEQMSSVFGKMQDKMLEREDVIRNTCDDKVQEVRSKYERELGDLRSQLSEEVQRRSRIQGRLEVFEQAYYAMHTMPALDLDGSTGEGAEEVMSPRQRGARRHGRQAKMVPQDEDADTSESGKPESYRPPPAPSPKCSPAAKRFAANGSAVPGRMWDLKPVSGLSSGIIE